MHKTSHCISGLDKNNTYFYTCSLLYPEHLVQSLAYSGTSKSVFWNKQTISFLDKNSAKLQIYALKSHYFVIHSDIQGREEIANRTSILLFFSWYGSVKSEK